MRINAGQVPSAADRAILGAAAAPRSEPIVERSAKMVYFCVNEDHDGVKLQSGLANEPAADGEVGGYGLISGRR